jgi:hypothetical protein
MGTNILISPWIRIIIRHWIIKPLPMPLISPRSLPLSNCLHYPIVSIHAGLQVIIWFTLHSDNALDACCPSQSILWLLSHFLNATVLYPITWASTRPPGALHLFGWERVEGVALEPCKKGGAHSPIPEFFHKLFPVAGKQHRLLASCYGRWTAWWLTVDELWHPLFFLLWRSSTLFI